MSTEPETDIARWAGDVVRIDVPAVTEQLRLVRLVVSSLATSHGGDMDDLEDLRIATAELCAALVSESDSEGRLLVEVEAAPVEGRARLRLSAQRPDLSASVEIDDLASMVLGTTTDSYGVGAAPWGSAEGNGPAEGSVAWFERALAVGPTSTDG